MQEGEPVGVFFGFERRFMHQSADGEVRHQQAIEFLPDQIRRLAAQHDTRAPQVSLKFIECGLSGKGLARYTDARPVSSPSP